MKQNFFDTVAIDAKSQTLLLSNSGTTARIIFGLDYVAAVSEIHQGGIILQIYGLIPQLEITLENGDTLEVYGIDQETRDAVFVAVQNSRLPQIVLSSDVDEHF